MRGRACRLRHIVNAQVQSTSVLTASASGPRVIADTVLSTALVRVAVDATVRTDAVRRGQRPGLMSVVMLAILAQLCFLAPSPVHLVEFLPRRRWWWHDATAFLFLRVWSPQLGLHCLCPSGVLLGDTSSCGRANGARRRRQHRWSCTGYFGLGTDVCNACLLPLLFLRFLARCEQLGLRERVHLRQRRRFLPLPVGITSGCSRRRASLSGPQHLCCWPTPFDLIRAPLLVLPLLLRWRLLAFLRVDLHARGFGARADATAAAADPSPVRSAG
mmetsp:Transcript_2556/g.10207  ORF Transcript_2556/g.10207 Transcript_2556/m.10207 type:complete len:273 (+) Transcript_2556:226-1044(+)